MAWRVERSKDTDRDLGLIFDFLVEAARGFGEPPEAALDRAEARILAIEKSMVKLGSAPYQGRLLPDLGEGIRAVTKDRAIFYFTVDDDEKRLRVLAVFFGGQDQGADAAAPDGGWSGVERVACSRGSKPVPTFEQHALAPHTRIGMTT